MGQSKGKTDQMALVTAFKMALGVTRACLGHVGALRRSFTIKGQAMCQNSQLNNMLQHCSEATWLLVSYRLRQSFGLYQCQWVALDVIVLLKKEARHGGAVCLRSPTLGTVK